MGSSQLLNVARAPRAYILSQSVSAVSNARSPEPGE